MLSRFKIEKQKGGADLPPPGTNRVNNVVQIHELHLSSSLCFFYQFVLKSRDFRTNHPTHRVSDDLFQYCCHTQAKLRQAKLIRLYYRFLSIPIFLTRTMSLLKLKLLKPILAQTLLQIVQLHSNQIVCGWCGTALADFTENVCRLQAGQAVVYWNIFINNKFIIYIQLKFQRAKQTIYWYWFMPTLKGTCAGKCWKGGGQN